jgi:excisionase family DNA binding protein
MKEPFKILSVKETCNILNVSVATLYRWESEGNLPFPKIHVGPSKVGFRDIDVYSHVNSQIETETA